MSTVRYLIVVAICSLLSACQSTPNIDSDFVADGEEVIGEASAAEVRRPPWQRVGLFLGSLIGGRSSSSAVVPEVVDEDEGPVIPLAEKNPPVTGDPVDDLRQSAEAETTTPIKTTKEPEPPKKMPPVALENEEFHPALKTAEPVQSSAAEVEQKLTLPEPIQTHESDDDAPTGESLEPSPEVTSDHKLPNQVDVESEQVAETQNVDTLNGLEVVEVTAPVVDPLPLERRPLHLVPAPVPFDVSYHFATHDEVVEAAKRLEAFLTGEGELLSYASDLVMIYTGAWEMIQNQPEIRESEIGDRYFILPPSGRALEVEGGMAFSPEDITTTLNALRSVIGKDFTLRSMQTLEMAEWWTYTGVEIEEPALVVETGDGTKQYLFFLEEGKIAAVEELDSLPDLL